MDFAWSDLGGWDAVLAASARDAKGNAVSAGATLLDCEGTLVRVAPGGPQVAVVGARGLAIIIEKDAVLVCVLASSQSVKGLAERLPPMGARGGRGWRAALARLWRR